MYWLNKRSGCIRSIFERLCCQDIDYVVLRNYESLPDNVGKDIDIMVDPGHISKFIKAVIEASEGCDYIIVGMKWNLRGVTIRMDSAEAIVAPDDDQSGFLIHAVTFISFKSTKLFHKIKGLGRKISFRDVGSRKLNYKGCSIAVLDERSELVVLYAQFQRKRKKEYAEQLLNMMEDTETLAWVKRVTKSDDGLLVSITDDDAIITKKIELLADATWPSKGIIPLICLYYQAGMTFLRFKTFRIAPIVYFSGPDGSGKTSNLFRLEQHLKTIGIKCFYFKTHQIILAILSPVLSKLRRIVITDLKPAERGPFVLHTESRDRDTGTITWRLRRLSGLIFGIIELFPGLGVAYLMSRLGYTVIIETSPLDIFVKRHRPKFPSVENIVVPFILKPTIGFIMKAEAKVIVERKPELTEAEINDYYDRMNDMLDRSRMADVFFCVDTNDHPEKSFQYITQSLMRAMNKMLYDRVL